MNTQTSTQPQDEVLAEQVVKAVEASLLPALDEKIDAKLKELNVGKTEIKHGVMPGLPGTKASGHLVTTKEFLKALLRRDFNSLYTNKSLSEGVDSAGGFLVPEETFKGVDRIVEDSGIIRKLSRRVPMSSDVLNMPILGSAAVTYWPGEGNAGTDGSPVFANVALNAKTASTLAPITNELLQDSGVSLTELVMELFAEAIATAEDTQGLVGTGSPFTGVLNHGSVTVVTMASGKDTFAETAVSDIRDLISQIKSSALPGCAFVMHRAVFGILEKITENSQSIVAFANPMIRGNMALDGTFVNGGLLQPAGYIFGYPVYLSDVMPSVTAVSTKFVIFGNFRHFYFGDRQQMSMALSDSATIGSTNTFESNMQAVRVTERVALAVGVPSAFAVLKTAAS